MTLPSLSSPLLQDVCLFASTMGSTFVHTVHNFLVPHKAYNNLGSFADRGCVKNSRQPATPSVPRTTAAKPATAAKQSHRGTLIAPPPLRATSS